MDDLDTPQSRLIIFIILLSLIIPSITCSLYIFYHFIRSRELRQSINNHVILVLLIMCFIQVIGELPLTLIFLRTGSSAVSSNEFCLFWIIFNYTFGIGGIWMMTIASVERYWLVFHRNLFHRHLLLLHYIPITLAFIYPLIIYTCLVTRYPCTNVFDYSYWTCGGACYLYEPIPGTIDWIINCCVNVLLTALVTCMIIIRVLVQRQRVTAQRTVWQRSRRIIMQLIVLSALYITVWLPCLICFLIPLFIPVLFLTQLYTAYLSYYQYLACLLCPFVCLLGSHEIRQALRIHRQVQPSTNTGRPAIQRLQYQT